MQVRGLLPARKLESFRAWLTREGFECRDGRRPGEVLQVRLENEGDGVEGWFAVYRKGVDETHLHFQHPLLRFARRFLADDFNQMCSPKGIPE